VLQHTPCLHSRELPVERHRLKMQTSDQDGPGGSERPNRSTTMDATTFDGISRNLGSVSTRRGFVRLLGGAASVGAVLAAGTDALARNKRNSKGHDEVGAQGKRKRKKITICYLNKTKRVKKSKLGNFPGATRGACPAGGGNQGGNQGGGNQGGGEQPAAPCTRWILSGGPSQTAKISVDDDLGVYNLSRGGTGIINEFDRKASVISPTIFEANVGDRINIVAYDGGGCRSLSELWLHCLETGASRKVYAGFNGGHCSYGAGTFVNTEFIV
jgi:hypothetical protein